MPLGFVYLAGHARRAGAEVRIYDAMSLAHSHEEIAGEIESFRPDIVAVSTITAAEPDAREVCRTAKRLSPNTVTVLGGVHPTFCWRETLSEEPAVDVCVRGEGEHTFEELVRAVGAGDDLTRIRGLAFRRDGLVRVAPPRPLERELDDFLPAWDLLDWPRYFYRPEPDGRFAIVSSSRGCRQRCSFCSQQKMWEQQWRARDPEKFVTELEMLRDRHGVTVVMLADETPTVSRARWEQLLDLMIERRVGLEILMETRVDDVLRDEDILEKYRAAGVSHLYVGVESGDQEKLDLFKKDTKVSQSKQAIDLINAHGIISETSFVLGMPDDTPESIKRTVDLAKWYSPDMAFFLAIAPWPYADLYPVVKDHIVTHDWRRYNLVEPVVKPRAMTIDQLRDALFRATGSFFHDKFTRLSELTPDKRDYMVKVLKLLIEHSYLGDEMRKLAGHAEMPPAVKAMLDELGISFDARGELGTAAE